jgi:hypothetical protein
MSSGDDKPGASRAEGLLEELLQIVKSLRPAWNGGEPEQRILLSRTAKLVVAVNPARAETFARSVIPEAHRVVVLATLAAEFAGMDPIRADRLFAGIEGKPWDSVTAAAVARMATAIASTNPRRSKELFNRAVSRPDLELATAMATWDPKRAMKLLDTLAPRASAMRNANGQKLMSGVVRVMADLDPQHAERLARSITHPSFALFAAASVAKGALAAADPDCAERMARKLTDPSERASLLADIAVVAVEDPGRYARLIDEASQLAETIMDARGHEGAWSSIIKAIAVRDPDRAEARAQTIVGETGRPTVMVAAAAAIAVAAPDRAERIAQAMPDQLHRDAALDGIAQAIAVVEPERAVRIIGSLSSTYYRRDAAVAAVAKALVVTDLDRAEQLARDVGNDGDKASALVAVIKRLNQRRSI